MAKKRKSLIHIQFQIQLMLWIDSVGEILKNKRNCDCNTDRDIMSEP